MKRKVVSYIRVSTDEQAKHGDSILAQRQILQDYAKGHNLEVVQEFEESQSAYKPGRPEFAKMLKLLKKRADVTGVLCYKIDRIARNLRDYSELSEMSGVGIISATEALPDNSTGELIGGVQAVFSRYFSDQLSERVKLGMETKAKRGMWPTYAPIGYLNDPDSKGIIPDPERADPVREVFEAYMHRNISLSDLASWATARGLRTRTGGNLRKSTIHGLLTNPIYYGAVRWKGNLYDGIHEPLISRALFKRVQERLSGKSHPSKKREFPFRGLLQCGYCGCAITAVLKKGKYIYYHCTQGRGKCSQPYVRQNHLSEMLLQIVQTVHLSEQQVGKLLDMMQGEKHRREEERLRRIQALGKKQQLIRRRRDAAYDDKLDGKITEERWLDLDRRWAQQEFQIKCELELVDSGREPSVDDVQATLELLKRAPILYLRQNDQERARLLKTLLWNCKVRGENLEPIYRKPFDVVAIGVKTANWHP